MLSRRSILLAPLAALALAAPAASAAEVAYDVSAFTFVNGTATGSDGGGWDSKSKFSAEIDQQIQDIPANPDGTVSVAAPASRVSLTSLRQDYLLDTAIDTLRWSCVHDGEAEAGPGSFELTRWGDTMTARVTVAQTLAAPRSCTGYSAFAGDIDITQGPLEATFSFPAAELADGAYSKTIDLKPACGEWTMYQIGCSLDFAGSVSITRHATAEEPAPDPQELEAPGPRAATPIKPKLLPGAKGAAVAVKCATACTGKVSATAAAGKGGKAKPLGSKSFASKGGTRNVTIMFGKGGSRTARQRGAVIIDVKSSGASKSYRLSTR